MKSYICEFIGTFLLVLLVDSSAANASLNKSGMKNGGVLLTALAGGFAVMLPIFLFASTSGAHLNPALTIALALDGTIGWNLVPGYIIAQFIGAFVGAVVMYIMFKDHFDETDNANVKFGCFAPSPSIRNIPRNMFCEIVVTFILVFCFKGVCSIDGITPAVSSILMFGVLCALGMSFGGNTGCALNPARDVASRLAYAVLPVKDKVNDYWSYTIVTIIGPIFGGILGSVLFMIIF